MLERSKTEITAPTPLFIKRISVKSITISELTDQHPHSHDSKNSSSSGQQTNDVSSTVKQEESDQTESSTEKKYVNLWNKLSDGFRLPELEKSHKRIAKYEKWYTARPKYLERLTERAYWYLPTIVNMVEERGMPSEIALLPAIESAYQLHARSRANAVGMWQFIASTGRRFGLRQDWWYDARRDLLQSTRAALDYLDFLSKEFNGDWALALASYNAGEYKIKRARRYNKKRGLPQDFSSLTRIKRETRDYVPKLIALRNIVRSPEKFGVKLKKLPIQPTLQQIDAKSQTDLTVASNLIKLQGKRLRYFNRGYKRGVTPPNGPHKILVPIEYAQPLTTALNNLSHRERLLWARHRVRKGDFLGKIARKYRVSIASLKKVNNIRGYLIRPGQVLRIPISTGAILTYSEDGISKPARKSTKRGTYRVRRGDSLWKIARRNGLSVNQVARWNNMSKSSRIHPGQRLVLRRKNKGRKTVANKNSSSGSWTYRIKSGDSLWSISRRYGLTISQLANINGLRRNTLLIPGQRILISN